MDNLRQTGQTLGRDFNSRCERARAFPVIMLTAQRADLKVENSAQTTFRLSTIGLCAPHSNVWPLTFQLENVQQLFKKANSNNKF
jgi:hypothetical protein